MSIQSLSPALADIIFQVDEQRLAEKLATIKTENIKLGGSFNGFTFNGEIYTELTPKQRRGMRFRELDPTLHADMRDYLATKKILEDDRIRVTQTFSAILIGCTSWQDVRDSLPEGLSEHISATKNLPRTREVAFNLAGNARAIRQFEKNSAIIAKYLMARYML